MSKITKTVCKDCGANTSNENGRCLKCEKARKQYINRNIKAIQKVLNTHEEDELDNGNYRDYKLTFEEENNRIKIDISIENKRVWGYIVRLKDVEDLSSKGICKAVINEIYESDINLYKAFVNNTKNFNNRKIKSLALWTSRENTKKVQEITRDLVERYTEHNKAKNKIEEYKTYICDFYNVLWELCPSWKAEDICTYVNGRFEKFNIVNVDVEMGENILIISKGDKVFQVEIDSYSKKEDVFREIKVKLDLMKGGI